MVKRKQEPFASLDLQDFLPYDMMRIPPLSASLHYAHAIFEGMSLVKVDGKLLLFHPWLNLRRMRQGADAMGMAMPYDDKKIIGNIFALAAINGFHRSLFRGPALIKAGKRINRFYVRPLLFVESDGIGLGAGMKPRFMIATSPMGEYIKHDKRNGIDAMLFPFPRMLQFPSIKTAANYQLGIFSRKKMIAFNEQSGEDCKETLFTNFNGHIVEGSGENVVLLRDNELITPHSDEGALPGITVALLGTISRKLGLRLRTGAFRLKDIEKGDGLILTGNAAGLIPVSSIVTVDGDFKRNGRFFLGSGRNKTIRRLRSEYARMEIGAGEYLAYHSRMSDWLEDEEADRLYACGMRFRERVCKAYRRGLEAFSVNRPTPHFNAVGEWQPHYDSAGASFCGQMNDCMRMTGDEYGKNRQ